MPFSSLDPKSQKFLKKYFVSARPFRSGTSQEEKDRMADELLAWQNERARMAQKLQAIPDFVDGGALAADLEKIANVVEGDEKRFNAVQATNLLQALDKKIEVFGQRYFDKVKKEASEAVDKMKTYQGVALKLPQYEARLKNMDAAFSKSPPDFNGLKSGRDFVVDGETKLKQISDDYQAEYLKVTADLKANCDDRLALVSDPLVAEERKKIIAKAALARTKLEEHASALASRLAEEIYWDITHAEKIVKEKDDYQPIKLKALTENIKLRDLLNPGADDEYPLIEADIAQAADFETKRNYYSATLIMKPMPERIAPLLEKCRGYEAYEKALIEAGNAVDQLKKHHLAEYVQTDIKAIEAFVTACIDVAAGGKYDQPTVRLGMVPQRCKDAEVEAENAGPFARLLADAAGGDLTALLKEAQARLKELQGHKRASELGDALTRLDGFVASAEASIKKSEESAARAALTQAAELAARTYKLAEIIDRIYTQAEQLAEKAKGLAETHGQAKYIKGRLDEVGKLVGDARTAAGNGDEGAVGLLASGETKLDQARKLADAEEAFRIRHGDVTKAAAELAKGTYPDKAATDKKIQDHLSKSVEHSKAFDHVKANGSLSAAEALIAVAKVSQTANSGGTISADDIRAIIALPDGQRQLDAMVDQLPPNVTQKVMSELMAARFNMEVKLFEDEDAREAGTTKSATDMDAPAPNLKAYYKMLSGVPETHSKLNKSLARFDRIEDESGSYYESTNGVVVMACYADFDEEGNELSATSELGTVRTTKLGEEDDFDAPGIDPDCVCVPDSADAPDPTYGKWTTLHEIGHAVDERKRFMASNGGGASFGGWKEHGADTSQVSEDIAKHFDFDRHYIEDKMAGGTPELPDTPDNVAQTDWEQRRDDFHDWLAAVRHDQDLWDSASKTAARKLKSGRVVHEAYEDTWVSYDYRARAQGVTGYQFRAPGEWFSELYAAFHTGKLNPSHPARKWLASL